MKKWSYLLAGMVIGVVVTTSGSAFANQIQTLIGKTVAGEYDVKVNGAALAESAIVVEGKAHVPLRAVSDSLGANLVINGKTIDITTGDKDIPKTEKTPTLTNNSMSDKFKMAEQMGYDGDVSSETLDSTIKYKETLERSLKSYEENKKGLEQTIETQQEGMEKYPLQYERRKKNIENATKKLEETNALIAENKEKIAELDRRIEILTKINQ